MRTYILAGAAVAFALVSSPAAPATYVVTKTAIAGTTKAHIVGPGVNANVRLGMLNFTVAGMPDPIEAFCIDPYHRITLGVQNPTLTYETEEFTHDFGGNTLSLGVRQEIAWLANYGFNSNSSFIEQAVQGAIWRHLPGFSVTVANVSLQAKIDELYALDYKLTRLPTAWASQDEKQSVVTGPIPEPATWAMLIMGFCGIGAMLRRRRQQFA